MLPKLLAIVFAAICILDERAHNVSLAFGLHDLTRTLRNLRAERELFPRRLRSSWTLRCYRVAIGVNHHFVLELLTHLWLLVVKTLVDRSCNMRLDCGFGGEHFPRLSRDLRRMCHLTILFI